LPDPSVIATGVTVSNLGAAATTLRAELYNSAGAVIRTADFADLQPRAQLTKFVHELFGLPQVPEGAAYLRLSAPEKLIGFELYMSWEGSLRFDGILGAEAGGTSHAFPMVRSASPSYLRVTDLSGSANAVSVTAYGADGTEVGTYKVILPARGQHKATLSSMFGGSERGIGWIAVSTTGESLADYVYSSLDGSRMGSYGALPADR
jgi:hypothetical protein